MFQSVAIVNRGEIAVRIIQSCKELGFKTILFHSEVDRKTLAYRLADETFCLGSHLTSDTYLNIPKVIEGLEKTQADSLHPGFGFLSENSDFVKILENKGIIFIGPNSESMYQLGNKIECKKLAQKAHVPLIPGYEGDEQNEQFLVAKAHEIGFPVIIKAAAGGGGRGMKIIKHPSEALEQIQSAKREALAAFGSDQVFLEKYLDQAKHVEFQIFVDSYGNIVHLFERECSVQRRHQKIIEESLATHLSPKLRQNMAECAKNLVKLTNYRGAATVEFLTQGENFYLLEVNTRLQVEHPVTEMVMGIDLVKAQLLTAQGIFKLDQNDIKEPRGHSIECRIYAENPYLGGVPSIGSIVGLKWPYGPHRRFDCGIEVGDEITPYYDPMIAKVIVWDLNRSLAIQKMKWVLKNSVILGVYTNIPYLLKILEHPEFIENTHSTQFISKHLNHPLTPESLTQEEWHQVKEFMSQNPKLIKQDSVLKSTTSFSQFWRFFKSE